MNKRKITVLLAALTAAAMLASCGESDEKDEAKDTEETTTTTTAPAETTTTETETTTAAETTTAQTEPVSSESAADSSDASSAAAAPAQYDVEISDELFDFEFAVNDEVYALPTAFSEFKANGWEVAGGEDETVTAGGYLILTVFEKGEDQISFQPYNLSDEDIPMTEAKVGEVDIDSGSCSGMTVQIAKGITLGSSTLDDVKAAFGEPSDIYDGDYNIEYTYNNEGVYYSDVKLSFDAETKVLNSIELRNMV